MSLKQVFLKQVSRKRMIANSWKNVVVTAAVVGAVASAGCVALSERALVIADDVVKSNAGMHEKRVQVAGHNIVYLEGGQGPALLLLHGFSAKKEHFGVLSTSLVAHHRVFIPDIPAFGESTYDPAQTYSPSKQAERLVAFADAIGLQEFAVAGNSMGGHLATLIAAKIPGRVTHLVVMSPSGVKAPNDSAFTLLLKSGVSPFAMKSDADAERLLALQFHTPPDALRFVKPALLKRMRSRGARNASLFRDYLGERSKGIDDKLPLVVAPTLILWGDQDQMLDRSGGPIFEKGIARSKLIALPNCGHLPQMECPTETAAHMLRFLAVR